MNSKAAGCTECGAVNRLPVGGLHLYLRCWWCRAWLRAAAGAGTVTDATFEDEVVHSPLPTLVDCWAPWCGPCRTLAPVIDKLAREYAGRARVVKLNVDDNPAVAARYSIAGIPTLLFFRGGRLRDRLVGAGPRAVISERLAILLRAEVA